MRYRAKMKPIKGIECVESNIDDVIERLHKDMNKAKIYMDSWSWTLHNDLPYSKHIELGFTYSSTGKFYPPVRMLQGIETIISSDIMPFENENKTRLYSIHRDITNYFKKILAILRSKNRIITPVRSGLLAGGKKGIFNYSKADKRYRDGDYKGWQLTVT